MLTCIHGLSCLLCDHETKGDTYRGRMDVYTYIYKDECLYMYEYCTVFLKKKTKGDGGLFSTGKSPEARDGPIQNPLASPASLERRAQPSLLTQLLFSPTPRRRSVAMALHAPVLVLSKLLIPALSCPPPPLCFLLGCSLFDTAHLVVFPSLFDFTRGLAQAGVRHKGSQSQHPGCQGEDSSFHSARSVGY
jgi:hypothetical protein